ncbi:hypothetical protein ACFOEE_12740 [Pseudoalteromonas fenneropenaei]|uniref:DUF805 domain-containing protein n=1 Tax=Pseudoalteromonas fenneropenaei TaxID=1737459 RepID=A0ABV7CL46_9GAMM
MEYSAKGRQLIMGIGGISIWQLLIILIIVLIPLLLFRPIAKKAGYSGWWALIMLVPIVNLIIVWVFAFAKWPAEKA